METRPAGHPAEKPAQAGTPLRRKSSMVRYNTVAEYHNQIPMREYDALQKEIALRNSLADVDLY